MLQFHGAICDILGISPVMSPLRLEVLAEREHFCRTELPAAVIEWFALADAEIWFHRHTNEDHLVHVQELGMDDSEQIAQGWLRVAWENQGVVQWFCKLDGTDDPSVWHDADHYGSVPFSQIPWVQCAYRFSEFMFDFLAAYHYGSWEKRLFITATSPSFPDATRRTLQAHFQQGPFTEQDPKKVYRFYNEQALIYVSQGEPLKEVKWRIHPASQDALREVLRLLKPSHAWLESWQVKGNPEWSAELGHYLPTLAGERVLDEYRTAREVRHT